MALPPGKVIALSHTKELEPGDLIHIVFAPGHLGFFKYGSEAIFAVVKKTSTGEVVFRDRSGSLLEPLGGSKDQLLSELRKHTDFKELSVIRPTKAKTDRIHIPNTEETVKPSTIGEAPKVLPPVPLIVGGIAFLALLAYWFSSKEES